MNLMRIPIFSASRLVFASFLTAAVLFTVDAVAYPSTVGAGYHSCTVCHYNPHGNGPLTDYGRALAATKIAARPFFLPESASDEDLGEASDFLGPMGELPPWFRPSIDFRGMYLIDNLTGTSSRSRFIPMQLEGSTVFTTRRNRLFGVLTLGYAPPPASLSATEKRRTPTLITREHYVAYRPSRDFGIYAGLMDPLFGTRVPDHNAFHRKHAGLAQNDQTHGILLDYGGGDFHGGLHLVAGNLLQSPELRQKGVSTKLEYHFSDRVRAGFSMMGTLNEFRRRQILAAHAAIGIGKGSSLLAEAGVIREDPFSFTATLGQYVFLQGAALLSRGLYLLNTLEYYSEDVSADVIRHFRVAPALQYFPMQRIELRVDLGAARSFNQGTVNDDVVRLMSQIHVYL